QPALSKQIRLLEEEIGYKLFNRHKKGMELSDEGKLFLDMILPLIKQFDEVSENVLKVNRGEAGNLTIATLPSFTARLAKILSSMLNENSRIHITVREGQTPSIVS